MSTQGDIHQANTDMMTEEDENQVSSTTPDPSYNVARANYEDLVTIMKYNLSRINFEPGPTLSGDFPNQVTPDARETWITELMRWGRQLLLLAQEVSSNNGRQVTNEDDVMEAFHQFKRKLGNQATWSPESPERLNDQ